MTSTDLTLRATRVIDADEAFHVGQLVLSSGLFADISKAEQVAVKVMAGAELGIGPIAATRGVDIIKGEVSLSAGLCAALVKRSDKYDYKIERWDDEGCTIVFFEHGEPLNPPITFDKNDATRAGLDRATRSGEPSMYEKYPRAMYFARAMTIGARAHCADLFAGSVYTSEELGAAPVDGTVVDAAPEPVTPPIPAPAAPPPELASAPEPAPSTPADKAPQGAPAEPPGISPQNSWRSSPAAADGPAAPPSETTTPAQIMKLKGFGAGTQRMMLIEVGVEDVGDLDAAYRALSDEQAERLVAMAHARAT